MKTKTGKKVTALLTAVLLLGVTTTSVLAASGMVHEGGCCDTRIMAKVGITPQQIAKMDAFCSLSAQKVVKEKSTKAMRYDFESGWVEK